MITERLARCRADPAEAAAAAQLGRVTGGCLRTIPVKGRQGKDEKETDRRAEEILRARSELLRSHSHAGMRGFVRVRAGSCGDAAPLTVFGAGMSLVQGRWWVVGGCPDTVRRP